MDLNKEIKLSELFRRKAKEPDASTGEKPAKAERPAKDRKPRFARKEKAAAEPKAAKAPKAPRRSGKRSVVEPKPAPALPAIPLMRAFNLQPGEETRERSTRLGLAQVLVALLGLLLIGGLGSAYIFMGGRVQDRKAQVDDLRAQLADLEVPAETPARTQDAGLLTEGQARTLALGGALQGRVAWDRILREVSLVLPEEAYLTQVNATSSGSAAAPAATPAPTTPVPAAEPNSLTLVGAAKDQALVAQFIARLEVVPEFASVDLQSSTYQEQEHTYAFSIVAKIAPGGSS